MNSFHEWLVIRKLQAKSYCEHDYLYDAPDYTARSNDSSVSSRAFAAGAFIPPQDGSRYISSLHYYADRDKFKDFKYDLRNKTIVLSRYRQAPIASPLQNQDITVNPRHGGKPVGGLWYTSGYAWIEHAISEQPKFITMFVHEIIKNDAKILKIRNEEDNDKFEQKYGVKTSGNLTLQSSSILNFNYSDDETILINWPDVQRDYAGIEITSFDALKNIGWRIGWDLPSGCIWNQKGMKDSRLLYVYDVKSKQFVTPKKLGIYAGFASKSNNPLPTASTVNISKYK